MFFSKQMLVCSVMLALLPLQSARSEIRQQPSAPKEIASNDNFVVTAPTRQIAVQVLQEAERLRDEIALEWLGQKIPPSIGTANIRVEISEKANSARTWPGANLTRPTFMIWITTSAENAAGELLAHEIAHVVLATRYPGQLPPWANEGIASRRDDAQRKSIRREILAWHASTGNWPSVGDVLRADRISPSDQARYALASSLIDFLLTEQNEATVLNFAVQGGKMGWNNAAAHFLGIPDVDNLQLQWRRFVTEQLQRAEVAAQRRSSTLFALKSN